MEYDREIAILLKDICFDIIDEKRLTYYFICGWYYMLSRIKSENGFEIIQIINNDDYRVIKCIDDDKIVINNDSVDFEKSSFFFGEKQNQKINFLVKKFQGFQVGLFYTIHESLVKFYLKFKREFFENSSTILDHLIILLKKSIQFEFTKMKELSKISFLTEYDEKIWLKVNSTDFNFECKNKSLMEIFQSTVKIYNKKPALIFQDSVLTFDEMNKRVNKFACYLHKHINSGSIVGVCFSQSLDMIIIIFSILKCGGIYLPLDKNYPRERLNYMVKDSGMKIIITEEKFENLFSDSESNIMIIEKISEMKSEMNQNLQTINLNNDTIYILYTSGSTNKPKGDRIVHYFFHF